MRAATSPPLIELDLTCTMCSTSHHYSLPEKDVRAWKDGALIQVAMPYLDFNAREMLISGICSDCFDSIFKEEE